jgi:catechol 2,3-dioxygenase-like lactoylglutathione lyase family enzyme
MNQRLALVSRLAPDYDAAVAFFTDELGFDLAEDKAPGGGKR